MDLAGWNSRLEHHFGELRQQRSAVVGDKPLFVLEHGLSSADLQDLTTEIRAHISVASPHDAHWLPWIVYAAELGYRYSGDEYWQTFEEETSGWLMHGERDWVRQRFQRFHKQFGGAKPAGPWAEQFTIICWPITHAILPRDLQKQLARILYELRHSFSAELFESPGKLGEFIAARSWTATSRFQKLTEDPQLVGQIAAALLLQGEYATRGLIHPATLLRISRDLDDERRGRDWLRAAQKFAHERVNIRGLAFGRSATQPIVRPDEARAEVAALGIEPRLILRPTDSTRTRWEVSLEIPDLSSLLFRFPATRETLTQSRCVVAGTSGRPLASERVLRGGQRVTLERWPQADEVLLKFQHPDQQLDFLLRTECLLRPGSNWLFRIASDGLAYELRSLRVRAGERYVLVTTGGALSSGTHVHPVELSCSGVTGALIDVPEAIDDDLADRLKRIGLSRARSIEVWPAGLAAVTWDGEGHGEWLASERVCLGIRSDHAISSLVVSMSSGIDVPLELKPINAGQTLFVELPQLPVGLHKVRVSTRDQAGIIEPLGDLDVMMRIREARPWAPTASPHGPLLVEVDPPNPSLEQLWEGHVDISISGPRNRKLRCRASILEAETATPIASLQLPPLDLPIERDAWARHFEQHFRRKPAVQAAYDEARTCTLDFMADELGAFSLRCRREFTPLRWALRRVGGQVRVRLIDDTGSNDVPALSRYPYEAPVNDERLALLPYHDVPASGGLYVAKRADVAAAVLVPPTVKTLADLQCVPVIQSSVRSTESVRRLVDVYRVWATARLPGDVLSSMRQKTVLHAIATATMRHFCGDAWARAEASLETSPEALSSLLRLISQRPEDRGFLKELESEFSNFATLDCVARVRLVAALAHKWKIVTASPQHVQPTAPGIGRIVGAPLSPLVEIAFRLASDLRRVDLTDAVLRAKLISLMDAPVLARAVRLLVFVVDRAQTSRTAPGESYAGWDWS